VLHDNRGWLRTIVVVTEEGSYLRLIDFVSLNLRLKDLLGPVTREKKKKKLRTIEGGSRH